MASYYNEFDPKAAAWLRELIAQGLIAPGDVDTRSIVDVRPDDLRGYAQHHFFAGIGVWSYALRRAGWDDARPVWTGSCPCQPFSAAGKGAGFADERHLWPAFFDLIRECRPDVVLGEQVASKDGLGWLDLVHSDLEGAGYAVGAVDTCAAGFGAPHIRQRLWWVGTALEHTARDGRIERWSEPGGRGAIGGRGDGVVGVGHDARLEGWLGAAERAGELAAGPGGLASGVAQSDDAVRWTDIPAGHECDGADARRSQAAGDAEPGRGSGGVGNAADQPRERVSRGISGTQAPINGAGIGVDGGLSERPEYAGAGMDGLGEGGSDRYHPAAAHHATADNAHRLDDHDGDRAGQAQPGVPVGQQVADGGQLRPGPTNAFWAVADWLHCRDGRWRPVESGTFPLAHGAPARVGRLRGYGNAICAPQAKVFCEVVMEALA